MPIEITTASSRDDLDDLTEMLREYLTWDINQLCEVSGIHINPEVYVTDTLYEMDAYFPPRGRLLLVRETGNLVGMGFLKPIIGR